MPGLGLMDAAASNIWAIRFSSESNSDEQIKVFI
jgi:hypothetical protein